MNTSRDQGSPPYDVILVMGAGVWRGGVPSPAMHQRVSRAVECYEAGIAHYLLMTGGVGMHPPAEALVMRDLAVELGVPAACVVLESESATTLESLARSAAIMSERGWSRVLLVTHAYHLFRSVWTLRTFGLSVQGKSANLKRLWKPSRLHVREGAAVMFYAIRLPLYHARRQLGLARRRQGRA